MTLKPFSPEELAEWATEVVGADPSEYVLEDWEFTISSLAASFDPPITYDVARGMVKKLRAQKVVGEKSVKMGGKRVTVFWRLDRELDRETEDEEDGT